MRSAILVLSMAVLPACATLHGGGDTSVGPLTECVVDGAEARTPGGAQLMVAPAELLRCAAYGFAEGEVVVAETAGGSLYIQWDDGKPFEVDVGDVELVQHVWAQQGVSAPACAFPGLPAEPSHVDVPIYLGRGAARPHLSAPGRVYTPGPPGAGACRRVFVGADPVAFATHGVPTGQKGRLVAVESAGGWADFEHVPSAQEGP